jgi:hypothetical protein
MRLATCRSGRHYHAALAREDQLSLLPPRRYALPDILKARLSTSEVEQEVTEWFL